MPQNLSLTVSSMPIAISPTDGNIVTPPDTTRSKNPNAVVSNSSVSEWNTGSEAFDTVSISGEALRMQAADTVQAKAEPPTWQAQFGFVDGEHTLNNGNKQVVTIEDDKLEVLEYDPSGKLLKKIDGVLSSDAAVLDTEFYDANGRVNQTIHTELTGLEDSVNAHTTAKMSRTVQWFDNGTLTRQMHDAMDLESKYTLLNEDELRRKDPSRFQSLDAVFEAGTTRIAEKNLDDMLQGMTFDTHKTRYFASIQEYANGRLSKDVTILQKATHNNITNRDHSKASKTWGFQEGHTTREVSHNFDLKITMTSYDKDGDIQRQVDFRDKQYDGEHSKDGSLSQSLSVAWYNKGELVKRSSGTLTMQEVEGSRLAHRPSLLDTLGMKEATYSGSRPQAASGLLATITGEAATEADHFGEALRHDTASVIGGAYNTAGSVLKSGSGSNPYNISWTNEIFRDGQLAARQEDKESATKSPVPTDFQFHTGGGLTEDDTPSVVKRTMHRDESYENGLLKKEAEIVSHEFVKEVKNGADEVRTHTEAIEGSGLNRKHMQKTISGRIDQADREYHAAAKGFSGELRITLDDVADTFKAIDER